MPCSETANGTIAIVGANGLRAVLDDDLAVSCCERHQFVHVAGLTEEMNGQYRFCAWRDSALDGGWFQLNVSG